VRGHEDDPDVDETAATARGEIELTRAEMTSTIEAIQERLDPEALSEQAKDTAHDVTDYAVREAKEAAREITDHALMQAREAVRDITGQAKLALREATIGKVEHMARTATESAGGIRATVVETIKANPMPAALVGLGLGWMFLNRPNPSPSERYGSGYGPSGYNPRPYASASRAAGGLEAAADTVQQTAGQVADRAQATAGQVVDQVQGTAGQLIDQVQEQGARAQSFLQRQLDKNPLLVGAVAVAIGGVLAGTVRSTPREDELLGATRDRLMGNARQLTRETMHKIDRVVDEAQNAAQAEAREQSLIPEAGSQASAS
jgi:hypothetical protein